MDEQTFQTNLYISHTPCPKYNTRHENSEKANSTSTTVNKILTIYSGKLDIKKYNQTNLRIML